MAPSSQHLRRREQVAGSQSSAQERMSKMQAAQEHKGILQRCDEAVQVRSAPLEASLLRVLAQTLRPDPHRPSNLR